MYKNKKGISGIITILIIIALVLVAVGVIWYVVQNVLEQGRTETEQAAGDLFGDCAEVGTVTTEDGICEGGEIRIVGGEYCCIV